MNEDKAYHVDGVKLNIAALMPLKIDPEKTTFERSYMDIQRTCDAFLVLHDNAPEQRLNVEVTEQLWMSNSTQWNDFTNRLALLARAATYGCQWVMMLDDDETLSENIDYHRLHELCATAQARRATKVVFRVKTAWDDKYFRTDEIFGTQRKSFLLQNPFMLKNFEFEYEPSDRLHRFPTVKGHHFWAPHSDFIVHWGMRTRALREKNTAKYQKHDPEQQFSPISYDYLLREEEMTLEPL